MIVKKFKWLLLSLIGAALPLALLLQFSLVPRLTAQTIERKMDPALQLALEQARPDEQLSIIIYLTARVDLRPQTMPAEKMARRAEVVHRLQETAAQSQAKINEQLAGLQRAGHLGEVHSLWIINALALQANPQAIQQLAQRTDVAAVKFDATHQFLALTDAQPALQSTDLTWGLARIRAAHSWYGLGIDGDGVTVAIMDTGVDWLHPALQPNYRGNLGSGGSSHPGSWLDIVDGAAAPFDPAGHGTHVAGTAVGQAGIGVAPGARSIAVRILDEHGFGSLSDVHLGFQWLLAPNGDPALAPDLVNNSWSGSPNLTDFIPDVLALRAAGIVPIFAAGNKGPGAGTIGAPASYTGTLAIAASDDEDKTAWFSSRGPSILTGQQKPTVAAPGTAVLSSLPNGAFGLFNGTSMATPHVVGAYALLLSANPTLSEAMLTGIVTSTAVPMAAQSPDNDSGWGRLDGYAAVASQLPVGRLTGLLTANGQPLAGVALTITTAGGRALPFATDANGRYDAPLQSGSYDLTVKAFGYFDYRSTALRLNNGQTRRHDIALSRRPGGLSAGQIRQAGSQLPLTDAVVWAEGTPLTAAVDGDGRFRLALPVGSYELMAASEGHRIGRATVTVTVGAIVRQDFELPIGPTTLLVDGGRWRYRSQVSYFRQALLDSGYAFAEWPIIDPTADLPEADDLLAYDIVIWSALEDAPGSIGAGQVISTYLDLGGNLLLSGQNVGRLDSNPQEPQYWWQNQLHGRFLDAVSPTMQLSGTADTLFTGLILAFNGPDSAANQQSVEQSLPQPRSLTQAAFVYPDGAAGGLQVDRCAPFRLIYLGFGLEGVSGRSQRAELMDRSLDYLTLPEVPVGVAFQPAEIGDIAPPGMTLTYTVSVVNISESLTDTFQFAVADDDWAASLVTTTLTLGPCESGETILRVEIPAGLGRNVTETLQVTAVSANDPGYTGRLAVHLKSPDYILLVDDDRWFDQSMIYRRALSAAGFSYDFWAIEDIEMGRGSPSAALLNSYEIIIWYTGYDWYQPLTDRESDDLAAFLAQGGRLFLTSQDYLAHHADDLLTQDFLGILQYQEPVTPTRVFGGAAPAMLADMAGPLALDYGPYRNFSDGLVARPEAEVALWHNQGMAGGVGQAGSGWRSLFWALPFETLPPPSQGPVMNRIVGWLSDLGETAVQVDQRTAPLTGAVTRTYTITLRNESGQPVNGVRLTNTLPASLTLLQATISGGASYDAASRRLSWQGPLAGGQEHTIHYEAVPLAGLPAGSRINNHFIFYDGNHQLRFQKVVPLWVGAPDLSQSTLHGPAASSYVNRPVSYSVVVRNGGHNLFSPGPFSATLRLPNGLRPLSQSLQVSGGQAALQGQRLHWSGVVAPGEQVTITVALTAVWPAFPRWQPATLLLSDGVTELTILDNLFYLTPFQLYFPAIAKNSG